MIKEILNKHLGKIIIFVYIIILIIGLILSINISSAGNQVTNFQLIPSFSQFGYSLMLIVGVISTGIVINLLSSIITIKTIGDMSEEIDNQNNIKNKIRRSSIFSPIGVMNNVSNKSNLLDTLKSSLQDITPIIK